MAAPRIPLRIGVVQLNPKIGQVQANLAKAKELCRKITPNSLDLLCFPEMAFTGYAFDSASSIRPFLEKPQIGPTSQFCSELAKHLQCYVAAGYPEELTQDEIDSEETKKREEDQLYAFEKPKEREVVGANSAVIYGPEGELVGGYRKTNLFETDMTWATPGTGFLSIALPSPLRNITLGICMDLNPHPPAKWMSLEGGPYEVAEYALEHRSNVVILLNAWLLSDEDKRELEDEEEEGDQAEEKAGKENQHAWTTLNFWAARLRPLWASKCPPSRESDDEQSPTSTDEKEAELINDETIVVVCNRSGKENGREFAGSSAVFSMKRNSGRPTLLDMMGVEQEGVRIWSLLI
ncbi:carbon-nitrogen hydrolase [Pluteus cervinus]|uniref:Carbon-nitrogen hydrolase n=1 Tax=Pluteus cervinus TaxID=181527 RepID=A0ACD3ACL2_9AGAR|nr:carbon-nitrogen hydrolase [Pluteus cervinus]